MGTFGKILCRWIPFALLIKLQFELAALENGKLAETLSQMPDFKDWSTLKCQALHREQSPPWKIIQFIWILFILVYATSAEIGKWKQHV